MTISKILLLVFLFSVLFLLIFLFVVIEYSYAKYSDPQYLKSKIAEKERLLPVLMNDARKQGFDSDRVYEIETLRSEICELYSCLEKVSSN